MTGGCELMTQCKKIVADIRLTCLIGKDLGFDRNTHDVADMLLATQVGGCV